MVLEVRDAFCGWNAGRWRLATDATAAACERTSEAADITVDVADLGAAYLGGRSLASLRAAGTSEEHRPGALDTLSAAMLGAVAPWSPEIF